MKKKRINLLFQKRDYHKIELFFHFLRVAVYVIGFLLIIAIMIAFQMSRKQNKELSHLLQEQRDTQAMINKNKEIKEKLLLLSVKNAQLKKFMKNDVNFLPYYKVLRKTVSLSTSAAALDNVTIDKDRNVNFDVFFPGYDSFINFFSFAESNSFLGNFRRLTLNSFTANEKNTHKYKLSFSGTFKNLDDQF